MWFCANFPDKNRELHVIDLFLTPFPNQCYGFCPQTMPKVPKPLKAKLDQLVKQFPILQLDGTVLTCKACNVAVKSDKLFNVQQHIKGKGHLALAAKKEKIHSMWSEQRPPNTFGLALCEALVSCDIPLYKLRNPLFCALFDQYTTEAVPSESTVREKFVPQLSSKLMENISLAAMNKFLWISIDETTDRQKNKVVNVIMGILSNDENIAKQKFLLRVSIESQVDHEIIVRVYQKAVEKLGGNFNKDRVLLFLTDAAPYIVLAGKTLKILYPKLIHVTCIVHGLHRVFEKIREQNDDVNDLVSNMKNIFVKSNKRVILFKETNPGVPLPPQPVITRWGTWLEAVVYYFKYWDETKKMTGTMCRLKKPKL